MSESKESAQNNDVQMSMDILSNPTYILWYGINHLSHIAVPVGLTMLFILVNVVRPFGITDALEEGLTIYMVYKEEAESTWDSIWQAVVNALVIVLFIAAITFVMVLLYKYNCTIVLYWFLYFATFMSIGYTGWFIFFMAVTQYYISWDMISSALFFFNLGVISVICIFGKYAPDSFKKCFLVFISCLVCYLLSFFPDWTTWVLLVCMALYDMCAVLTPCGPLRLLLNLSQTRDDDIPGLLYEATLDRDDAPVQYITDDDDDKKDKKKDEEKKKGEEGKTENKTEEGKKKASEESKTDKGVITDGDYEIEDEDDEEEGGLNRIFYRESVQLGLGDFIFYSLMVSKASLSSTVPFIFVFIIILAGLLITMALLSIVEMPLPALPFSMILGVTTYAITYFVITSMVNSFALNGIMY